MENAVGTIAPGVFFGLIFGLWIGGAALGQGVKLGLTELGKGMVAAARIKSGL